MDTMEMKIIADSCCDLTPALKNLWDVKVASLRIDVGDIHYVDDESMDTMAAWGFSITSSWMGWPSSPSTRRPYSS